MYFEDDLTALWLTLKLAVITTLILIIIGTPVAWWLARSRWKMKFLLEAVIALPLVLPPTVLGFYLLIALGPSGPLGGLMQLMELQTLNFTFSGLVIGSVIYSLPFVVQPLQQAFANISQNYLETAATLGATPWDRFVSIVLPLSKSGYLTALVLGVAHTLGEFGVVLMIGGNIPGETQVLSIVIYDHVEALEYEKAHRLAGGLLILSFVLLLIVYRGNRRLGAIKV